VNERCDAAVYRRLVLPDAKAEDTLPTYRPLFPATYHHHPAFTTYANYTTFTT